VIILSVLSSAAHRIGRLRHARTALFLALCLISTLDLRIPVAADILPPLTERILSGAESKYGPGARVRLQAWSRLIAENRAKPEMQKLQIVNDFFNRIPYVSDMQHWGKTDYWATPVETLASNGADCEDFAIAKYFTLLALNVRIDKLKITYVKASSYNPINQSHMVLTYYSAPNAVPLVLDNLIPEIRTATQRRDLTPVYAFNGAGLWLARQSTLGRVAGGTPNIRIWTPPQLQVVGFWLFGTTAHVYPVSNCCAPFRALDHNGLFAHQLPIASSGYDATDILGFC